MTTVSGETTTVAGTRAFVDAMLAHTASILYLRESTSMLLSIGFRRWSVDLAAVRHGLHIYRCWQLRNDLDLCCGDLAYVGITNVFAVSRLLPGSDRDKDAEILALRHQLAVLQRQLGGQRVRSIRLTGRGWPRCCTGCPGRG
jgi:hypothetical protein